MDLSIASVCTTDVDETPRVFVSAEIKRPGLQYINDNLVNG